MKLGEFKADDFKIAEGKTIADTAGAQAVKLAVETAIAAKSAKQIAATGHPHAIDVPAGDDKAGDTTATPASAADFLATYKSIKDPGEANAYFRKHSHRFPI